MRIGTAIKLTILFVLPLILTAPSLAAPGDKYPSKFIYINVEGNGVTKHQALFAAYKSATKIAIENYLAANPYVYPANIVNPFIDKIIDYSRGIITSHMEIYSENKDRKWTVYIKAEIDNELMQKSIMSFFQETSKPSDNTVLDKITPNLLLAFIEGIGGSATIEDDNVIFWSMENGNIAALKIDGSESRILFLHYSSDIRLSADVTNGWNNNKLYSRVYLDSDKDPILRLDVNLKGGVSAANVENFLKLCLKYTNSFHEEYGNR